jgi:methylated-DNA-protein-cysteine methyltransferase-like protein
MEKQTRTERILARVRAIPEGFVSTYATIDPVAPRLVGRVLAAHHEGVSWHRVVRADGTAPMGEAQLELLRAEKVPLAGDRVDFARARSWAPSAVEPKAPPTNGGMR